MDFNVITQVLCPLKCVLQKTKSQKHLQLLKTQKQYEDGDTIYVHQNASINHAYNQTIFILLSSALIKGTLPVSLSYIIPTKVFQLNKQHN